LFIGIEHIDSPRGQRVESFLSQALPGFARLLASFEAILITDWLHWRVLAATSPTADKSETSAV
jgi:hypothetical protein